MNILPATLALLMILAMASYTFLQGSAATEWEKRSCLGFMKAQHKLRNAWEKSLFQEMPKKTVSEKTPHSSEISESRSESYYESPRRKKSLSDLSKLNIGPLLIKPAPSFNGKLYESAAHMIRDLYQTKSFFKDSNMEHLEYRVLDGLIETGKSKESASSLAQLFPSDPKLRNIFYKMLKGTNTYDLLLDKGIPPLGDFFIVDRAITTKPVYFAYASELLLVAFFGKKNVESIIETEKQKWEEDHKHHALSKTDLETIILSNTQERINLNEFEDLLNFAKSGPSSKTLAGIDKTTGINLKKKL
ncbi:MAG TPA: hypothetical protein VLG49_07980 [Rhabdochlamydiaceae bacterium]|nr:hypothetical protein [Rhabdochlamydiaceae bacterium]